MIPCSCIKFVNFKKKCELDTNLIRKVVENFEMVILYCFAFRRTLLDFDLVQHCRIISKNYVITLEFMTFYGIRMTSGRVTNSREILSSSQGLESRGTTFPVISNSKIIKQSRLRHSHLRRQ